MAREGGEGGNGLDGVKGIAGAVTIGPEPAALEEGAEDGAVGIGEEAQPASSASRVAIRVDLVGMVCLVIVQSILPKKDKHKDMRRSCFCE